MRKLSRSLRPLVRRAAVVISGLVGVGLVAAAFFTSLQTSLANGW